jgi:hypothetical protein
MVEEVVFPVESTPEVGELCDPCEQCFREGHRLGAVLLVATP